MATNVKITHIEDTRANITSSKRASMLAYDTTNDTLAYVKANGTTERNILTMDTTNSTLYALGDFQYADESWIGLGGSAGRLTFNDEGTDNLHIEDADLWVEGDVQLDAGANRTISVAAAPSDTVGDDLTIAAGDGTGAEYAGGDLYLNAGRENGTTYEKIYFNGTDYISGASTWSLSGGALTVATGGPTLAGTLTTISSTSLIFSGTNLQINSVEGIDYYSGSAVDFDLLTVTTASASEKLWWDNSEFASTPFRFTKGVHITGGAYITSGVTFATGGTVLIGSGWTLQGGAVTHGRNVDEDLDLISVDEATESPLIKWDTSEAEFNSTHGFNITGDVIASGNIESVPWTDYSGTTTVGGFSGTPTVVLQYKVVGDLVFVKYDISGTSTDSSFNFTVPYTSANDATYCNDPFAFSNGGSPVATPGRLSLAPNSATVNLYIDWVGSTWNVASTKQAIGKFWYEKA